VTRIYLIRNACVLQPFLFSNLFLILY
jgi:hypothetical protein